jgi:hypothetical protein
VCSGISLYQPPPPACRLGWLGYNWRAPAAMARALAAALFRGPRPGAADLVWLGHGPAWSRLSSGCACAAGVDWYTFLWLPGLVLVARPAVRGATITGIAAVAGSAAALLTWGAMTESRLEAAQQDAMRLGRAVDPVVVPLLDRAGARLRGAPPPRDAQLYAGGCVRGRAEGIRLAWLAGPTGGDGAEPRLAQAAEAMVSNLVDSRTADSVRIASPRRPGVTGSCCSGSSGDLLTVVVGPEPGARADRFGSSPHASESPLSDALRPAGLTPDTDDPLEAGGRPR